MARSHPQFVRLFSVADQLGIDLGKAIGSPLSWQVPEDIRQHVRSMAPKAAAGVRANEASLVGNAERQARAAKRRTLVLSTVDRCLADLNRECEEQGRSKHGIKAAAFKMASDAIAEARFEDPGSYVEIESPESIKAIYYGQKAGRK